MPATAGDLLMLWRQFQREAINEFELPLVLLEKVGGFIRGVPAPGSAMFNFGQNYGHLEAFVMAHGFPLVHVRPQEWQKAVGVSPIKDEKKTDHKNRLKAAAQRYFPETKVTLWNCDALLIGWAGPRLKLPEV